MRVLLTTDTVGGVWTFTRELTEGLLHLGHVVALVSFGRNPAPEQWDWVSTLQASHGHAFAFSASALPLEWMQQNERAFDDGAASLSLVVDSFNPDVLHSSQFCFGALGRPLPRLITAHSDVLSWAEACRPDGLDPSSWLDQYRDLVQHGLDRANAVVAPTFAMLHALAANFHLPSQQHVIANGRSLPLPSQADSARTLQAVTAGRLWDEAKNIALLSSIDSFLPLVVAGEQSFSETQTEIDAPSLRFVGALTESQLLQLFRSSALYIAPSLYEPFGLAPLEAALCGCAILANDLPSLREIWGDAALFFTNAAELERQLHTLAQNPHALASAQQRAHARALTLSRSAMVNRYLDLYRELIDAHQPPAAETQAREHQRVA